MIKANKTTMLDPCGKRIIGYMFGDVMFHITGTKKPRINGMCNDSYGSEHELTACYDNEGQGVKLIRLYEDGTEVLLRPR